MSEPCAGETPASDRLRRAARRAEGGLADIPALLNFADQIVREGARDSARLVYVAALLGLGASADEAAYRSEIAGRAGLVLQDEPRETVDTAGRTSLDLAVFELGALARSDAATIGSGDTFGVPLADACDTPIPLEAFAVRLLLALHRSPSPETFAEVGAALDDLRRGMASEPSSPSSEDDLTAAELGRKVGLTSLCDYVRDIYAFAFPPWGSPAILHALSRLSASGLGPYGRRAPDFARNGREALGLLQLALGEPLATAPDAQVTRGALLLTQRAPGWLRREIADGLADLGLVAPLRAMTDVVLRTPELRRERELLQTLRDAGLDLGDLQVGWDAQHLLAGGWSEDRNEWQALGDVAAYRGGYAEAERAFETALRLDPHADHAASCLAALRAGDTSRFSNPGGFSSSETRRRLRASRVGRPPSENAYAAETRALELERCGHVVIPELAPDPPPSRWIPDEGLHLRRLGAIRRRSYWGELPVLGGVEAVRGFYVSRRPIEAVSVSVGGRMLGRGGASIHPLPDGREQSKCAFNVWIDLSTFAPGRYEIELRLADAEGEAHVHREHILVQAPVTEASAPTSDAIVDPPQGCLPFLEAASLEAYVNARPSAVRPARRALFDTPPERVLVVRADQLGDMVCAIPALRRLRQLLPGAQLTGLVTTANAALARSLGVFDDLIVIDFRTDPVVGRRLMPVDRQVQLEADLHARKFDLAIDLAENSPSRYLLLLSGAKRLCGVQGDGYGFLDLQFQGHVLDRFNGSEQAPASNKMLAMMEWLGASMASLGETIRRHDLSPSALRRFGLGERDYVVLHTGARLQFSRWPHYPDLARRLLARTGLSVVLISDEPMSAARLGPGLVGHERFQLIERALPFDDLDLLLSYCAAFVGNDSGPKHLASLRGSEAVSLHCARNNWNEWGQENTGVIISRRVPCAGCQIRDYPDECGKAFVCMTAIAVEEVLEAVLARLPSETGPESRRPD